MLMKTMMAVIDPTLLLMGEYSAADYDLDMMMAYPMRKQ